MAVLSTKLQFQACIQKAFFFSCVGSCKDQDDEREKQGQCAMVARYMGPEQ
jgi:hypothetical protein